MTAGQNDDIDPATATGRVAAASRARSAAPTALKLASATRLPSPAGSKAARLAANVDQIRHAHFPPLSSLRPGG